MALETDSIPLEIQEQHLSRDRVQVKYYSTFT